MPNIIIKNEYGEDELYEGVNTVRFLNEEGNVVSYKYNSGEEYARPTGNVHRVRFLDYDGFVLKEIYVDSGDTVYYPTTDPTRDGYTFIGWNWSEESLQTITQNVDIGAMYVPDTLTDTEPRSATTIELYISYNAEIRLAMYSAGVNTFNIDWGDGTSSTVNRTSAGSFYNTHKYNMESATMYHTVYITVTRTAGEDYYSFGVNPIGTSGSSYNIFYSSNSISTGETGIRAITFADEVTYVPSYMCCNCQGLRRIVLSNNTTYIGSRAFGDCASLEKIAIPPTVTEIGEYAFSGCGLLDIETIPLGITQLQQYTFYGCKSLQCAIPNGVTSIGARCFEGVRGEFVLPNTLETLSSYAFASTRFSTITIPEGVTAVPQYCFNNSTYLRTLYLPSTITSMGYQCFYNVRRLEDLYIKATTPPTLESLALNTSIYRIHIPAGTKDAYTAVWGSKTYIEDQ